MVAPEALDHLPADHPAAIRSRRDLARIHQAMGTGSILRRAMRRLGLPRDAVKPLRVLELGAGDGRLLLGLARARRPVRRAVELTLLDRLDLVDESTRQAYRRHGWTVRSRVLDVADWVREPDERCAPEPHWDLIVANLFLHHFERDPLANLLRAVAARADRFFACEPRRGWMALTGSHLVGLIGANAVTRADAVLSVQAGFVDAELSALWPRGAAEWSLHEYPARLFSHCFSAVRTGRP